MLRPPLRSLGSLTLGILAACLQVPDAAEHAPDASLPDPVARWTFDAIDASGTMSDIAGGYDAYCVTCPMIVDDPFRAKVAEFTGVEYFKVDLTAVGSLAAGTISAWVMPSVDHLGSVLIEPYADADAGCEDALALGVNNSRRLTFELEGLLVTVGGVVAGEWVHVAATWNATETARLYVNGTSSERTISAVRRDRSVSYIGADWDGSMPYDFFLGRLDDLRFYGTALDPAEIAALAGR